MKVHCLYDTMLNVKDIKPHPKNTNKHSNDQIERLAKILNYQGWRSPIKISKRSGFITAGHGRLDAAVFNKWQQVPVNFQDYESEEQELADITSDNAIALWAELDLAKINEQFLDFKDFDLDLLGIEDFSLTEPMVAQCEEDEVPEPKEAISVLGDLYELGNHRLLCGDSTDILQVERLMNGEKADMVFTDPPYGINEETDRAFASQTRKAKGNTFSKIIGDDSIDTALSAFAIADNQSDIVCYWGGNYYAHKLPPSACWIVWDKRVEENQRDMNSDCELAYVKHPSKKSVRIFRHLWKGMIKASENGSGRVHPTQKPIALAEWAFQELAPDSNSVFDLFGGSGSTLIACEKTNRKCFMMELDPYYISVIIERWMKYTGKMAYLLNDDGTKTSWKDLCEKRRETT